MTTVVSDRLAEIEVEARRKEAGFDRFDEVWDGVTMMSPLPNDEHQAIVSGMTCILQLVIGFPGLGWVRPGINVSDRDEGWTKNYRGPDVAVFLLGTLAVNRDTHWVGGPNFLVEILSQDDRAREKLDFYARIGVREMMVVDRDPWSLELYRLEAGSLVLASRVAVGSTEVIESGVIPLRFRLLRGAQRPLISVEHAPDGQTWTV